MTGKRLFLPVLVAAMLGVSGPALAASTNTLPSASFGLGNATSNAVTTQSATPPVSSTTTTSSSGLSGTDAILIGVLTIGVLVGIAVFIRHDARIHTARDKDLDDDPLGFKRKGSKAPQKSRKLKPAERKRRKRGRAPRRS